MVTPPLARAVGLASLGLSATAFAQSSSPYRIMVDLRLHETGGKEITVDQLGDTVELDLYVSVFGLDNDLTNDGLQSVSGGFRSSLGGLGGDLLGLSPVAPFNGSGTATGAQRDLDGDGDLDVGVDPTIDDDESWYRGRSNSPTLFTPPGGFYVGRVRFTATSFAGESTAVNWVPRTDRDVVYYAAGFRQDGANRTMGGADPEFSLGAPVTIRTGNVVDPGPTQYMSGTINEHVTISGSVKPQAGSTLTLANGMDVTPTGHFDSRNAQGQFGAHQAFIRDTTSGNAGGALMIGNVTIGSAATATFNHSGGFTNIGTRLLVGDAAGSHGRVSVSGGNFAARAADVGGQGDGTIHQTGGAANFGGLLLGTGAGQGSYALVNGDLFVSADAVISAGGSGSFVMSGGTANFGDRLNVGGRTHATAGTLYVAGGTLTSNRMMHVGAAGAGTVEQSGGEVRGISIAVSSFDGPAAGRYTISAGRLTTNSLNIGAGHNGVFLQNGGDVVSATNLFVSAAGPTPVARYELHNGTLRSATVHIGAHPARIDLPGFTGLFDQDGGAHVADRIRIGPGGTYRHTGGVFVVKNQLTNKGTLDFANAAVTFNADRDAFIDLSRGTMTGEGNANFRGAAGSLFSFPAGYNPFTQLGSIATEGLIHVAGQPLSIPQGYSVSGSGTITGAVTNAGAVSPGNSPGVLGVDGNYTQTDTGTLRIELAGVNEDQFDTFTVTGSAALDGALELALLGDFVPAAEDTFMILTAASRAGAFDNAIDKAYTADHAGVFDVEYGSWYIQLSNFQAIPEPAGALALLALAPLMLRRRRRNC